jgi:PTS system mannose-specific IIB component
MTRVALVRIDDRLIHGQVVVRWLRYLDCSEILIVDNELWRDDFMHNVLRLAAPPSVRVHVAPVQQAAQHLQTLASANHDGGVPDDRRRALVLLRSPQAALQLFDDGFHFSQLNVGGLAAGPDSTRLYKSVSANADQIAALRELCDRGVRVYFQTVPDERAAEMSHLLPTAC